MTVQIDDAGWGSLVGGMLVGVARIVPGELDQFTYGVVEPRFFQGDSFRRKEYLEEAANQAAVCFEHLQVQPDEPVEICTGYALEGVRTWLDGEGYDWRPSKITGPLQDWIEGALQDYLFSLGFSVDYEVLTDLGKKGLLWWMQIRWLKGGDVDARRVQPERAAVCKTGWASYRIWADYPYEEAKRRAKARKKQRRRIW